MYRTTVIVLCLGIVVAYDGFKELDRIYQERECSSQGGLCTIAADCPKGKLTKEKGLCPRQQSNGVECCYGVSVKETRCSKRGGECMPQEYHCNNAITYKEATDCSVDTTCCILTQ